jgi:hypothetical protein
MPFYAKYLAHPVGSHEAKILSHPGQAIKSLFDKTRKEEKNYPNSIHHHFPEEMAKAKKIVNEHIHAK